MTKNEFLQRFTLSPLSFREEINFKGEMSESAVLIPLVEQREELHVLLSRRAAHLRHHANQIAFPGGKYDEEDHSLQHTALRETEEEIGLPQEQFEIIGQLNTYKTISGFRITPFIGLTQAPIKPVINEEEVAEVFTLPLSRLTSLEGHFTYQYQSRRHNHPVHFFPVEGYNIWGATAAIIYDLSMHLNGAAKQTT